MFNITQANEENLKRFVVVKNTKHDYKIAYCKSCGAQLEKPNDITHLLQCEQCGAYNEVFIPLEIFHPLSKTWEDYHAGSRLVRKYLLYGSKGTAKTHHWFSFFLEIALTFPQYRGLVMADVLPQAIGIIKGALLSFCPTGLYTFVDTKTMPSTFIFFNGSTLEIKSRQGENKFGSLLWDAIICEEAKWLTKTLDKSLYERLGRGSNYPSFQLITANPDDNPLIMHFIKNAQKIWVTEGVDIVTNSKLLYSKALGSEAIIPILIDGPHNPYLTDEFIRENFQLEDPDWCKRNVQLSLEFVDNNLVPAPLVLDDLICPKTDLESDLNNPDYYFYGGIDWGFDDATTLVIIRYDIKSKIYTVVDIYGWTGIKLKGVGVLINDILNKKYNWKERTNTLEVVCDRSAGGTKTALGMPLLDYLNSLGLSVIPYNDIMLKERNRATNPNSLYLKIEKVRDLIKLESLRISDDCMDLINEIKDTPVTPALSPISGIKTYKIQRTKKGGHGDYLMGMVYGIWGCDTFTPPEHSWVSNIISRQFYVKRNFGISERCQMLMADVSRAEREEDSIIDYTGWEDEIF